ncbi:MAG: 2-oxo acid dehydrogenase subunit E2 [Kiritimatiellae bacterium]|jgi:pyruvate/2-oxoglutarate dehydrogenase complex dihydrolipoamide acyltransferase (E2) component|nr:2-oxo acid dehydrogenase subunit E2 [Kiritimatiellia bacterium]
MKNIRFSEKQKLTSYRKIAISSWKHPRDPSTYAMLDLPTSAAKEFISQYESEVPLTMTHFIAKIIGHSLEKFPELNHVLRVGKLQQRETIDAFITTLIKGSTGKDLSGFSIRDINNKSIEEVAIISKEKVDDLRYNRDKNNLKVQKIMKHLPIVLIKPLLRIREFFQYTLNLSLGMKDAFGSVIISNIGALGIENAFIPLSPYSRCPLIIGIGKPRKIPVVQGDEVVVEESMIISFTFDHRHADGAHGASLIRRFKKIFSNPSAHKQIFDKDELAEPAVLSDK